MGGVYAALKTSPLGIRRIESLYVDPPVPVEPRALGLNPLGVSLIERPGSPGVYDVYDWVGKTYYPKPADMLEEIRAMGMSRHLSKALDYEKITPESWYFLLHEEAFIDNAADYFAAMPWKPTDWVCKHHKPHHEDDAAPEPMCIELLWADMEPSFSDDPPVKRKFGFRAFDREIGSIKYLAAERPDWILAQHRLAIFFKCHLSNLAVINHPDPGTVSISYNAASASSIPVTVEDF